jgi:hypothetical protein
MEILKEDCSIGAETMTCKNRSLSSFDSYEGKGILEGRSQRLGCINIDWGASDLKGMVFDGV